MPRKKTSKGPWSKKSRGPKDTRSISAQLAFEALIHRERYQYLLFQKFGRISIIDSKALKEVNLVDDVQRFLRVGL